MQVVALRSRLLLAPLRSCARTAVAGRVLQVRTQATVPEGGPAVTATNRAEATLKRFWKNVDIDTRPAPSGQNADEYLVVTLDKRPLKTPSGNPLLVPKNRTLAATLTAAEWDNQETLLKQHSLPMTSLASRAIDAFRDEVTRKEVQSQLLKYLETDTVCFLSDQPPSLALLQKKHWDPLLQWARESFEVEINTTNSFVLNPHPRQTIQKFREVLEGFDEWQMAAMERATYYSKSFIIALALVSRKITAEQAAQASHVEVNSQIETWGEVEDSHDVDYHDIRRQLASAACLLATP